MAISATISVDKAWVTAGQHVHVLCVLANTGGADVKVTSVTRGQVGSSASNTDGLPLPPNVTIPAGGTLVLPWVEVLAANVKLTAAEFQYNLGATVYTDDGSVTVAPPATVIVVPQQSGQPGTPGLYPNPPTVGQLRGDTNVNSGLFALLFGAAVAVGMPSLSPTQAGNPAAAPTPGQLVFSASPNDGLVAVL